MVLIIIRLKCANESTINSSQEPPSCEGRRGCGLISAELQLLEIEQVGERSNHSRTLSKGESASISRGGNVSVMRPGQYCQR